MSRGHGCYAHLIDADDRMLLYSYCCYDANDDDYEKYMRLEDGEIWINRESLIEADIHEKIKKTPSGKKKIVTRRIRNDIPLEELFESNSIQVTNASGTWRTTETGIDMMACKLIYKLLNEYQDSGEIPEKIGLYY